jgi:hypothetical protein
MSLDCNGCIAGKAVILYDNSNGYLGDKEYPNGSGTEVPEFFTPTFENTAKKYQHRVRIRLITRFTSSLVNGNCPDAMDDGRCPQYSGCSGTISATFTVEEHYEKRTWTEDADGKRTYGPWVDQGSLSFSSADAASVTYTGDCGQTVYGYTTIDTGLGSIYSCGVGATCSICKPEE